MVKLKQALKETAPDIYPRSIRNWLYELKNAILASPNLNFLNGEMNCVYLIHTVAMESN